MKQKVQTENRQSFLDILRVAATLAVVLLHTVTGIMDATDMNLYPLEKKVFLIALDLITWCVPVFVLISGYLFLNPEREISFGKMLKKYCRRIVLALFLFGVPYACMELIMAERAFRPQMLWESILMVLQGKSWSHMWYLYLILVLYLITPMLKALLKKIPIGVVYGILAFLFLGSSLLPYIKKLFELEKLVVLPDGGIYLFYYLCGYLLARGRRKEESGRARSNTERKHNTGWRYIALGVILLLAAGMIASRLIGSYTVQMAYNYPFTVVLALLLVRLTMQSESRLQQSENRLLQSKAELQQKSGQKNKALWEKAGALCFAVYLVHPVFVNVYYKFLQITPLNFPGEAFYLGGAIPRIALSLPLFFLIIILPAILTAWALRRLPILRKYVL